MGRVYGDDSAELYPRIGRLHDDQRSHPSVGHGQPLKWQGQLRDEI